MLRTFLISLVSLSLCTSLTAGDGNRLTYLDELNPYYPHKDFPKLITPQWVGEEGVDVVLVPHVAELQYSIPNHTKINVFEIWMRYRYELYSPEGELVADWTMTSYGKTPTAFLQSAEAAVNLAAVVALRDAGANFAMNFANVPEVKMWMESLHDPGFEEESP